MSEGGIRAYRMLRDLTGEILSGDSPEALLARLPDIVDELLPVDACSVLMLDRRSQTLQPLLTAAGGRHTVGLPLQLAGGRMEEAIRGGRPLIVGRNALVDDGAPLPLPEAESVLTAMLIPLPVRHGMTGILWLGRLHGSSFTAEEQELAQTIAALVALAIQQHHVERHLRALAQRDPLTGLLTRDALQDSLARLLRAGTPCALLLLHLDGFKRFNAAHGQQAGDSLLREAGRLLCEEVRAGDESFRYGGEELAVVLPNADGAKVRTAAERLRRRFAALRIAPDPAPVTVSIGVAIAPGDARDEEALIARAGAALAHARHTGLDRVALAADVAGR